MNFIKKLRISITYKVRILYAFLKSDQIFSIYGALKIRPFTSDIRVFEQIFFDENYFFFPEKFDPKVIVDAGANVGYSSVWFSYRFKGANIIAIEPERRNFEALQENIKNWKNITPLEAAIWSSDSSIWIKDTSKKSWSFETTTKQETNSEPVFGISIPSLLKKYSLDKIDILKVDIEGAEAELFGKNTNDWLDLVSCVMIETHDKKIPGVSKIVDEALFEKGFTKFKTKDLSLFFRKDVL